MTEKKVIKVVKTGKKPIDAAKLNYKDRTNYMTQIKENVPSLNAQTLLYFRDMLEKFILLGIASKKHTENELILRGSIYLNYILYSFAMGKSNRYNENIIIETPPREFIFVEPIIEVSTRRGDLTIDTGDKKGIMVVFNHDVSGLSKDGDTVISMKGKSVNVIGLKLSNYNKYDYTDRDSGPADITRPSWNMMYYYMTMGSYFKRINSNIHDEMIFFDGKNDQKVITDAFDHINRLYEYFISGSANRFALDQIVYSQKDEKLSRSAEYKMLHDLSTEMINAQKNIREYAKMATEDSIADYANTPGADKILSMFNSQMKVGVSKYGNFQAYNHMLSSGVKNAYFFSYVLGEDSEKSKMAIQASLDAYNDQRTQYTERHKIAIDYSNAMNYVSIANSLFSGKKLEQINKKVDGLLRITTKKVLDSMTKSEREVVQREHEKRENHIKSFTENKCPHLKVLKEYISARTLTEIQSSLKRVLKFASQQKKHTKNAHSDENKYLKCSLCGYDLICPHTVMYNSLVAQRKKYSEINAAMKNFAADLSGHEDYFCSICSEKIVGVEYYSTDGLDPDDQFRGDVQNIELWREVGYILRDIAIGPAINISKMIESIVNGISGPIQEISRILSTSRTNSAEDIANKRTLFTTIYGYAFIINIMLSNPKLVKNRNYKMVLGADLRQPTAADYIRAAITSIMKKRGGLIAKTKNVTPNYIKLKMIEAYKLISKSGPEKLNFTPVAEQILLHIINDPVYKIYYRAYTLSRGREINSMDFIKKIPLILDTTLEKLDTITRIYDNVWERLKISFRAEWLKGKGVAVQIKDYFTPNAKLSYDNLLPYHKVEAVERLAKYIDISATSGFFEGSTPTEEYKAYLDEISGFKSKSTAIYNLHRAAHCANVVSYKYKVDEIARRHVPEIKLGEIYDKKGRNHKWDILVVEDGGKIREIKGDYIHRKLISGKRVSFKMIDKKCSLCGVVQSKASKAPEDVIRNRVAKLFEVDRMISYFVNKCPKDGVHNWDAEGKCSKCGANFKMIDEPRKFQEESSEYFDKYKKKYDILRKPAQKNTADAMKEHYAELASEHREQKKSTDKKLSKKYEKWKMNYNLIDELANATGENVNNLLNIGAFEDIREATISKGDHVAQESSTSTNTRVYTILSYTRELIIMYNRLRNVVNRSDEEIIKLLKDIGLGADRYAEIPKYFERIELNISGELRYFIENKRTKYVSLFMLEQFAKLSMLIIKDRQEPEEMAKLRINFVKMAVGRVIESEKVKTEPGDVDWNSLRKNRSQDLNISSVSTSVDLDPEFGQIKGSVDTSKMISSKSNNLDEENMEMEFNETLDISSNVEGDVEYDDHL